MARLTDLLHAHEHSAKQSRETVARLESDLEAAKKERTEIDEAAEARLQVPHSDKTGCGDSMPLPQPQQAALRPPLSRAFAAKEGHTGQAASFSEPLRNAKALSVQDLKSRVAASQTQHAEMLRRAQDICIEAEDRAAALEKKADKAEARAAKAEADLKDSATDIRRLASELKVRPSVLAVPQDLCTAGC